MLSKDENILFKTSSIDYALKNGILKSYIDGFVKLSSGYKMKKCKLISNSYITASTFL